MTKEEAIKLNEKLTLKFRRLLSIAGIDPKNPSHHEIETTNKVREIWRAFSKRNRKQIMKLANAMNDGIIELPENNLGDISGGTDTDEILRELCRNATGSEV